MARGSSPTVKEGSCCRHSITDRLVAAAPASPPTRSGYSPGQRPRSQQPGHHLNARRGSSPTVKEGSWERQRPAKLHSLFLRAAK